MKDFLAKKLKEVFNIESGSYIREKYVQSFDCTNIHKICVLLLIDSNKRDFAYCAIGIQANRDAENELRGLWCFEKGEKENVPQIMQMSKNLLEEMDILFCSEESF